MFNNTIVLISDTVDTLFAAVITINMGIERDAVDTLVAAVIPITIAIVVAIATLSAQQMQEGLCSDACNGKFES